MILKKSKNRKKSQRKSGICKCGAQKEIEWSGDDIQYPTFSCPNCGPERNEWEIWWSKYKDTWKKPENWDKPADKLTCIVGYFCNKYKEFYNSPYTFSYANPIPYKDKDYVMARRLLVMFDGNARDVKIYIRWVFKIIVKRPSYVVTSIGFLIKPEFVNRFKAAKARNQKIGRSSKLPKDFIVWCAIKHPSIFDRQELSVWNDLNGLVTHVKTYGDNNVESKVVEEAVRRGMLPAGPEYRNLEDR